MEYYKYYYSDQYFKSDKDLLDFIRISSAYTKYGLLFKSEDQLRRFRFHNRRMVYEQIEIESLLKNSYWLLVLEN